MGKFFIGHSSNLQDDGDRMRLDDFNLLMEFYCNHKTLKVSQEDTILEVFKYFVNRDMILEASTMQSNLEVNDEGTLLQEAEEEIQREDMETDSFLKDNLEFDTFKVCRMQN